MLGSLITNLIEGKFEKVARTLVMEAVNASSIGVVLNSVDQVTSFLQSNLIQQEIKGGVKTFARRKAKWQRGGWAKSRQEWLDEGWRHDWRSQPRDAKGRWVAGRLDYPLQKKLGVSRRGRKIRRFRKKYRAAGRSAARGIIASWGRSDGN